MKLFEDGKALLERAETILSERCISITDYRAPQSEGGIHDYYSEGTYWHPDPSQPDGKPYIQRDGIINKDNFVKHKDMIVDIKRSISILYWAYQRVNDMKYIRKIEDILYTFFLDPEKYLSPSLKYSQAIQGRCAGRSIGLIDFNQLVTVPLMVRDLDNRSLISPEISKGIRKWCTDYSIWLETSEFGKTESSQENNHSVAFYLQYSAFSIFRDDWDKVRAEISSVFKNRLMLQIAEDGSMPHELKRTRPYWYSIFSVELFVLVAKIISTEDDNLMEYMDENGKGVRKAVYYITPFMKDKASWTRTPDIERWEDVPLADAFLYLAGKEYGDESLLELYDRLPDVVGKDIELERNIPVFIPELI